MGKQLGGRDLAMECINNSENGEQYDSEISASEENLVVEEEFLSQRVVFRVRSMSNLNYRRRMNQNKLEISCYYLSVRCVARMAMVVSLDLVANDYMHMLGVSLVQCWGSHWCSDVGLVINRFLYHLFLIPPVYYTTC